MGVVSTLSHFYIVHINCHIVQQILFQVLSIFSKMVRLFARFKFPEIDKSYLPIMALLAKWSLSSRCIPIRPGSNEGEFNLIQNLRQKIIYYLSFSAIIFYILTFNIWFYKNFFGKSHPVWENLVIICFFTSINIVGMFQIELYFQKN